MAHPGTLRKRYCLNVRDFFQVRSVCARLSANYMLMKLVDYQYSATKSVASVALVRLRFAILKRYGENVSSAHFHKKTLD